MYLNLYTHIYTLFPTKKYEAVLLYVKVSIISKIEQFLLKQLHEHLRQVLIIKAVMRLV